MLLEVESSVFSRKFTVKIQMVHGTPPVLAIFVIGATSGGLMTGIMSPDKLVIGASGGDYALVFAYLGNLFLNWDSMKGLWKWLRLAFLGKSIEINEENIY